MDVVDRIEGRRFVGREFLVWLWFESELLSGWFDVDGFGSAELWFEAQLTLVHEKEQSKLTGLAPSEKAEAREALRQGKLPTQARMRLSRGEFEYALLFTADRLALSSVKIPAQAKHTSIHEQFYERMYLIEELETIIEALYGEFVTIRLSAAWDSFFVPAIRAWIVAEPCVEVETYRRKRREVVAERKAALRAEELARVARVSGGAAEAPVGESRGEDPADAEGIAADDQSVATAEPAPGAPGSQEAAAQ